MKIFPFSSAGFLARSGVQLTPNWMCAHGRLESVQNKRRWWWWCHYYYDYHHGTSRKQNFLLLRPFPVSTPFRPWFFTICGQENLSNDHLSCTYLALSSSISSWAWQVDLVGHSSFLSGFHNSSALSIIQSCCLQCHHRVTPQHHWSLFKLL